MYGDLGWLLEWILETEHRTRAASNGCGNGLRFHNCWYKALAFHIVLPFADFWVLEDNISGFNDVEVGWRVLDLHLESLIGRQDDLVRADLEVCRIGIPVVKEKLFACRVLQLNLVRGCLSKLALKHVQADNRVLLGDQIKVVPELTYFLIEEANVANKVACGQRTENQIVSAFTLGFQAEGRVADQALTLEEHFESDRFVQGV